MADFRFLQGIYPDFLSKKTLGYIIIDISSSQIKLFSVETKTGVKISASKIIDFPAEQKDKFILDSLQNFIKDNNISHKDVILIPQLSSYLIKRLELPLVPKEEIPKAIMWQIKDESGFDLSKVALDYQLISKKEKDGAELLDINCVVLPQDEIIRQVLLLKELDLTCVLVSLAVFGYPKIIKRYRKDLETSTVGVLHLDEEN